MKSGQAGKLLSVSPRQIRRLKFAVKKDGVAAIVHKLKGRQGNHQINLLLKQKALAVIEEKYTDFKPTFATEKLAENHGIRISPETTRLWMIAEKLWEPRKQKQITYRSWRPRKEYFGELEQFDGYLSLLV